MQSLPWRLLIWGSPMFVSTVIGVLSGVWGIGIGLAFVWLGFCIFKGSVILVEQEYAVIERLGVYRTVYFRGWHVYVIFVDRIRGETGDMRAQEYELYSDERATKIDFTDGVSAPVVVKLWWRIGKPEDAEVGRENFAALTEAVLRWTYRYANAAKRVFGLVDAELRPLLQAKSSDEASVDRNGIADACIAKIRDSLAEVGAYEPTNKQLVVIEDIDIPDEVIQKRQAVLEGEKRAKEMELEARGYWVAIKKIQDELKVSVAEARAIFETQRGLDTLRETKPAMTLVGNGLSGVLGTISLGGKS